MSDNYGWVEAARGVCVRCREVAACACDRPATSPEFALRVAELTRRAAIEAILEARLPRWSEPTPDCLRDMCEAAVAQLDLPALLTQAGAELRQTPDALRAQLATARREALGSAKRVACCGRPGENLPPCGECLPCRAIRALVDKEGAK